jgi:hypothetical protein
MACQARGEATRRKIIHVAIDLFDEIGCSATAMGDSLERLRRSGSR